jgi:hypothetical protein
MFAAAGRMKRAWPLQHPDATGISRHDAMQERVFTVKKQLRVFSIAY